MHLSPFPCKKLLIVPCDWLVASIILLFSAVPTLNEAHRHCADGLSAIIASECPEIERREQIQVGERFDYGLTPDIMAAGG